MIAQIFGYVVLAIFIGALVRLLVGEWNNSNFRQLVQDQFTAIVGLPASGVFSFLIVAVFESTAGQIKFEAFGMKFEGASGPILMWVLVFLAIVSAIKLLWKSGPSSRSLSS